MPLATVKFAPGFDKQSTAYGAEGKWIDGEPYDVLHSLCKNYDPSIADQLADEIFQMFNGATFLWLRYDPNYSVWSKYTDDWYVKKVNQIFDKATKIHK